MRTDAKLFIAFEFGQKTAELDRRKSPRFTMLKEQFAPKMKIPSLFAHPRAHGKETQNASIQRV